MIQAPLFEDVWEEWSQSSIFPNFGTTWRSVVSFAPATLPSRKQPTPYHCTGGWVNKETEKVSFQILVILCMKLLLASGSVNSSVAQSFEKHNGRPDIGNVSTHNQRPRFIYVSVMLADVKGFLTGKEFVIHQWTVMSLKHSLPGSDRFQRKAVRLCD
jgi:hypothetical protein